MVGDLDGNWARLLERLDDRVFDFDHDRLFCTGNLIGQGEDSEGALMQVRYPWFYSVLGSAELEFAVEGVSEWMAGINPWRKDELLTLVREHMPLAVTVETQWGQVGIIHADAPQNWYYLASGLLTDELWMRCVSASQAQGEFVQGVDALIHGHTTFNRVTQSGNRYGIKLKQPELALLSIDELMAFRAVG